MNPDHQPLRYPSEVMSEAELDAKYGDPWSNHQHDALWFAVLLGFAVIARWCWVRWKRR